jgi:hypothetical protein
MYLHVQLNKVFGSLDPHETDPLRGRQGTHDFTLLKFGGTGTCHLTLISLGAGLQ